MQKHIHITALTLYVITPCKKSLFEHTLRQHESCPQSCPSSPTKLSITRPWWSQTAWTPLTGTTYCFGNRDHLGNWDIILMWLLSIAPAKPAKENHCRRQTNFERTATISPTVLWLTLWTLKRGLSKSLETTP